MIEVSAKLRHARVSARKLRLVADVIRGLSAEQAVRQLQLLPQRSAGIVLKTLKSAMANAQHNNNLSAEQLTIKSIQVNKGVGLKRFRPAAMGSAHGYVKQAAHLDIVLLASGEAKPKRRQAKEAKAETKLASTDKPSSSSPKTPAARPGFDQTTKQRPSVKQTGGTRFIKQKTG